jgi:hypothetical protein
MTLMPDPAPDPGKDPTPDPTKDDSFLPNRENKEFWAFSESPQPKQRRPSLAHSLQPGRFRII